MISIEEVSTANAVVTKEIGILFTGPGARDQFFRFTCSCGSEVKFKLNQIPEVDTPMPCGKEGHWAVKYEEGA